MAIELQLEQITTLLTASPLVVSLQVLLADEAVRRSIYKIRCQLLRPAYQLEVRLIQTEEELLYSYQLFTDRPLLRWDNAPHFPRLSNFPHHLHEENRKIAPSSLSGDPLSDLAQILNRLRTCLTP